MSGKLACNLKRKFLVLKNEIKVIFWTKGYSHVKKRKFCFQFCFAIFIFISFINVSTFFLLQNYTNAKYSKYLPLSDVSSSRPPRSFN